MVKLVGIAAVVLIGLIAFAYLGSSLPDTNPLHGAAEGVRAAIEGVMTSVYGVGRGVAGVFGG